MSTDSDLLSLCSDGLQRKGTFSTCIMNVRQNSKYSCRTYVLVNNNFLMTNYLICERNEINSERVFNDFVIYVTWHYCNSPAASKGGVLAIWDNQSVMKASLCSDNKIRKTFPVLFTPLNSFLLYSREWRVFPHLLLGYYSCVSGFSQLYILYVN